MEQRDRAFIARIARMNYEDMVRELRFAPIGHAMFLGESGKFFGKRLRQLLSNLSIAEQVAISEKVGHANPK